MREPVGKKLRFEVFKRDKFTCQYCGAKAPDLILHCDHIHPVAKGGKSDALNLVTACQACNGGKGARLLDDSSALDRQRSDLEALQERREQLDMMLKWRDELERVKADTVQSIADRIGERGGFLPNETGKSYIRKWLKRFSFDEVLTAVDESFDTYMEWTNDHPSLDAWEKAFNKIPGVCSVRRAQIDKPYLGKLLYAQGILRNRIDAHGRYLEALEIMVAQCGADPEWLIEEARHIDSWEEYQQVILSGLKSQKRAKNETS